MAVLAAGGNKHEIWHVKNRELKLNNYINCIENKTESNDVNCLPLMVSACANSSFVAVKTLRFQMSMVEELLQKNSGLKVIHLVRDPRGSLLSRMRIRELQSDIRYEASYRCWQMAQDLKHADILHKRYPGRVLQMRYEDVAENPLEMTKFIYKFIGHKISSSVIQWIQNKTQPNKYKDSELYSTLRRNSSDTAHAWKRRIPKGMAVEIQRICENVIRKLNYTIFDKQGRFEQCK